MVPGGSYRVILNKGVEIKDHKDEEVVTQLMTMNQCMRKLVELVVMDPEAAKFASTAVDMIIVEVMRMLMKSDCSVTVVKRKKHASVNGLKDPIPIRSKGCGVHLRKDKYKHKVTCCLFCIWSYKNSMC